MGYTGEYPPFGQNGMNFSTVDSVHDEAPEFAGYASCPALRGGGWWYNNCFMVNLNGRGEYGFSWWTLNVSINAQYLDASRMMLKKNY